MTRLQYKGVVIYSNIYLVAHCAFECGKLSSDKQASTMLRKYNEIKVNKDNTKTKVSMPQNFYYISVGYKMFLCWQTNKSGFNIAK